MSNLSTASFSIKFSVRSAIEPVDPSLVPLFVTQTFIQQCLRVAIATVLIFDSIITIDKEAKYFWKTPRNAVDFVFFVVRGMSSEVTPPFLKIYGQNRYIGVFGSVVILSGYTLRVNLTLCNFVMWSFNIANWVIVILIDYILTIRVLALYSQNRRLSICLYALLASEGAFKLAIIIYNMLLEHIAVGGLAKGVTVCGVENSPPWQWVLVDWTIPLVYGVLLMILALYKAAEYWRISAGFKGFTLVKVLIVDQIVYFMLVIFVCVFGILQFILAPSGMILQNVMSCLTSPSFLCVLGSRMLFNLKEAGERGQNVGTSFRVPCRPLSNMEFAEPVNAEGSQSGDAEGGNPEPARAVEA